VADVAAHANSHVTTDGARHSSSGVGRPEEDTAGLDGVLALPDHGDDGPGGEVGDEALCFEGGGEGGRWCGCRVLSFLVFILFLGARSSRVLVAHVGRTLLVLFC
jgi:hypothetical protein